MDVHREPLGCYNVNHPTLAKTTTMNIARVCHTHNILGESPLWDHREKVLYWLDIFAKKLQSFNPQTGAYKFWELPEILTSIGLSANGGLIGTSRLGLIHIALPSGIIKKLETVLPDEPRMRFNDGKCDRQGRYWAGTMDTEGKLPDGLLYRFAHREETAIMDASFTIFNGLGWSPDNTKMYVTDSIARTIYRYDFSASTGTISNKIIFASISEDAGVPDGLTVDSAGYIWSAHWDGWRITRYAPDGKIASIIPMPIQRPTSCCFGGEDYNVLYITSAACELSPEELIQGPDAGSLFALETDVVGLREGLFGPVFQ